MLLLVILVMMATTMIILFVITFDMSEGRWVDIWILSSSSSSHAFADKIFYHIYNFPQTHVDRDLLFLLKY